MPNRSLGAYPTEVLIRRERHASIKIWALVEGLERGKDTGRVQPEPVPDSKLETNAQSNREPLSWHPNIRRNNLDSGLAHEYGLGRVSTTSPGVSDIASLVSHIVVAHRLAEPSSDLRGNE